jgi:hypothetical protein
MRKRAAVHHRGRKGEAIRAWHRVGWAKRRGPDLCLPRCSDLVEWPLDFAVLYRVEVAIINHRVTVTCAAVDSISEQIKGPYDVYPAIPPVSRPGYTVLMEHTSWSHDGRSRTPGVPVRTHHRAPSSISPSRTKCVGRGCSSPGSAPAQERGRVPHGGLGPHRNPRSPSTARKPLGTDLPTSRCYPL